MRFVCISHFLSRFFLVSIFLLYSCSVVFDRSVIISIPLFSDEVIHQMWSLRLSLQRQPVFMVLAAPVSYEHPAKELFALMSAQRIVKV